MMNGEQLYELYRATQLLLNNCLHDIWDDLDEGDQRAWNVVAQQIEQTT